MSDMDSVVIDCGSGVTKCGFGGERKPTLIFPSIVGHQKVPGLFGGVDKVVDSFGKIGLEYGSSFFLGEDIEKNRYLLRRRHPLNRGVVTLWRLIDKIWKYAFHKLNVDPSERPVFLTESPMNNDSNLKIAKMMFEDFSVPFLFFGLEQQLALFSFGKTSGLVCGSGDEVTHYVPVFCGRVLTKAINRFTLGGRDVVDYFVKILSERGYEFTTREERRMMYKIKEKLCFVSLDYDKDLRKNDNDQSYELPDGQQVNFGSELFRCTEILFKPGFIGMANRGFRYDICSSIDAVERRYDDLILDDLSIDSRKSIQAVLYKNIYLSGGNTLFPGFQERLEKEMNNPNARFFKNINGCRVLANENRYGAGWRGASLVSQLSHFRKKWISRSEYDEEGCERAVRKKCNSTTFIMKFSLNEKDIDEKERVDFVVESLKKCFEDVLTIRCRLNDLELKSFKFFMFF